MSQPIFTLLKILILSHKPLQMVVQLRHKQFNKTLKFCVYIIIAIHAEKTAWKMSHSLGPFQFYTL